MIALGPLALLRPWWLLAVPAMLLLLRHARDEQAGLGAWARSVDAHLLAAMAQRELVAGPRRHGSAAARAVLLGLLVLALAGPAIRRTDTNRFRNLDAILLLLDLSPEAASSDLIRQAQTASLAIIDNAASRQLGLVLYAGDAYLAAPLTDDATAASAVAFAVEDDTVPDPGGRPDRALALAARVLAEAHILHGDVVLISTASGVDAASLAASRALLRAGQTLHTLFLHEGNVHDGPGAPERRAALAALAAAGGGQAGEAATPEELVARLRDGTVRHLASSDLRVVAWRDLGRAVLLLAMVPLLLLFRRTA